MPWHVSHATYDILAFPIDRENMRKKETTSWKARWHSDKKTTWSFNLRLERTRSMIKALLATPQTSNKCITTSNKGITTSNKYKGITTSNKLLVETKDVLNDSCSRLQFGALLWVVYALARISRRHRDCLGWNLNRHVNVVFPRWAARHTIKCNINTAAKVRSLSLSLYTYIYIYIVSVQHKLEWTLWIPLNSCATVSASTTLEMMFL